jgi:hypothetical protein
VLPPYQIYSISLTTFAMRGTFASRLTKPLMPYRYHCWGFPLIQIDQPPCARIDVNRLRQRLITLPTIGVILTIARGSAALLRSIRSTPLRDGSPVRYLHGRHAGMTRNCSSKTSSTSCSADASATRSWVSRVGLILPPMWRCGASADRQSG